MERRGKSARCERASSRSPRSNASHRYKNDNDSSVVSTRRRKRSSMAGRCVRCGNFRRLTRRKRISSRRINKTTTTTTAAAATCPAIARSTLVTLIHRPNLDSRRRDVNRLCRLDYQFVIRDRDFIKTARVNREIFPEYPGCSDTASRRRAARALRKSFNALSDSPKVAH